LGKILELLVTKDESADDAYLHYLRGIIFLKLGNNRDAKDALVRSLALNPLCWCSWHQLAQIIEAEQQIHKIFLTTHWLKFIFQVGTFLNGQYKETSLKTYEYPH